MSESPIKKSKKYSTGALPKSVLAEAIGVTRKKLTQWIRDDNICDINRDKFFKPFEVVKILDHIGDDITWSVIDKYKTELKRRSF